MRTRTLSRAGLAAAAVLLLPACSSSGTGVPTTSGPSTVSAGAPVAAAVASLAKRSSVKVDVPEALNAAPFNTTRKLTVPNGWKVSVWSRTDGARLLANTPDGRILVSRPGAGIVTRLTPNARGYATSSTLISGLRQPHGMAFDGDTLYVAESNRIDAYAYTDGEVGPRRTVLKGLPDAKSSELGGTYAHALKTVVVGPDHALYISVGSVGNVSPADRTAKLQRATVLRLAKGATKPTVFARGVRNGTGLAFAPDGALWTAVNNRDQIQYPYHKDFDGNGSDDYKKVLGNYVDDHPMEPVAKLTKGRDLGWPYCNPDPDVTKGKSGTDFDYSNRAYVRDVQTNASGSKLNCGKLAKVEQGLPAHSAPLGMNFTTSALPNWGSGALVGVHGSWNRNPPRSPKVAFFKYSNGKLAGKSTLVSGWQNSDGSRWGRAVAALQGPDKAIYISDDASGTVYRLAPPN